jgi:UDPglucose--hexose-1-phosphate uridylyltransferase
MIDKHIKRLVLYGIQNHLLEASDYDYAINKLCDLLKLKSVKNPRIDQPNVDEPSALLKPLLDYAVTEEIVTPDTILQRDIFEAKLMDVLIPRPSEVIHQFNQRYRENPKKATDYFYDLSKKSHYIKTSRTNKNIRWQSNTPYGVFDMTINVSKPEKDPKDIINAKNIQESDYPKCLLCKEHVGYSGSPGRTNHRIIPLTLNQDLFHLQYSPYVYYNEHCIVLMDTHKPMHVSQATFHRLFDFVDQFPHYFLGSNAGLPIVGGSILSHEHYQGGRYVFPIEDAKVLKRFEVNGVTIQKLYWPLSVLRLRSKDRKKIIQVATKLYDYWLGFSNQEEGILAYTNEPHNAITPIARRKDSFYELDMTLRNNRTSSEHPLGIFHPHKEHHHIKKENIGLIEVMGLAVLPGRLKEELEEIKSCLINNLSLAHNHIHKDWLESLKKLKQPNDIDQFIFDQVALKFTKCLEDTGVFKQNDASQKHFDDFVKTFINQMTNEGDLSS